MATKTILRAGYSAAMQSDHLFKVGAVLFKGGSIFRTACNSTKIHADILKYNEYGTRHAERNVLLNLPDDVLNGMSLLVVRVNREGLLTSAKPCKTCYMALIDTNLKNIFYTDYSGEIKKLSKNLNILTYQKEYPKNMAMRR